MKNDNITPENQDEDLNKLNKINAEQPKDNQESENFFLPSDFYKEMPEDDNDNDSDSDSDSNYVVGEGFPSYEAAKQLAESFQKFMESSGIPGITKIELSAIPVFNNGNEDDEDDDDDDDDEDDDEDDEDDDENDDIFSNINSEDPQELYKNLIQKGLKDLKGPLNNMNMKLFSSGNLSKDDLAKQISESMTNIMSELEKHFNPQTGEKMGNYDKDSKKIKTDKNKEKANAPELAGEAYIDPMNPSAPFEDFTIGGNMGFSSFPGFEPFGGGIFGDNSSSRVRQGRNKNAQKKRFLDGFCTNLTEKARQGKIDRVIGREKELERVMQILCRRTKNNPCLIGEPGVGKTAIAEALAIRLAEGKVPFRLVGKEIYLLDLTSLIAGTQFRGQFESRVQNLISEIKSCGNIIIFIDEVHSLTGTGDADGTSNAANMFKPALSRGEMQVIGATTFAEYRKHIEKDSALERRFQPVIINEPTINETIELLRGIKDYYENHHSIKIGEDMLHICAKYSERYITDRFLPDKAIDLLDESAAFSVMTNPEISKREALRREIRIMNANLAKFEAKGVQAGNETAYYANIANMKTEIARKEKQLSVLIEKTSETRLREDAIASVVELWTGIPASKISESGYQKIARLEGSLKSKVIGQDEAVSGVANAVKLSRIRLSSRKRPASFIFVGPTGVGKTELVKTLASELFDNVEPLIRLDMSEFMEKHSVSRIVGSPPGYVGYDESGQLTEKVRRKPYCVVLFDEIEKAHPDVMNILLQILDEGKVTDAHGRTVDFSNTVICMTSNAGSIDKSSGIGFAKTENDISRAKAEKALKEFLRPEFLSRIDEIIVFNNLKEPDYEKIAELMMAEMDEPLKEQGLSLIVNPGVTSIIAKKSFGGKFGGRDIRNFIRKEIENKIADEIINLAIKGEKPTEVIVSVNDDNIEILVS